TTLRNPRNRLLATPNSSFPAASIPSVVVSTLSRSTVIHLIGRLLIPIISFPYSQRTGALWAEQTTGTNNAVSTRNPARYAFISGRHNGDIASAMLADPSLRENALTAVRTLTLTPTDKESLSRSRGLLRGRHLHLLTKFHRLCDHLEALVC